MILSSIDNKAMAKIGNEAALEYVEKNEMETEVLRWKLRIDTQANAAQDTALMYVWNAMSSYDLGKLCREWLAYGCGLRAVDLLEILTNETGEAPAPSLMGSEV